MSGVFPPAVSGWLTGRLLLDNGHSFVKESIVIVVVANRLPPPKINRKPGNGNESSGRE